MTKNRTRFWELLPILLLVASVPIFFGEMIWTGKPLFGSDFLLYFYPLKQFIRDYVLSHGTIPLWHPYQFSGTPLIANIQAAIFYPLGFLFYLIPAEQAYGYTIMLHCALGAIFMYAFARSLSMSRSGAFVAAAIFGYNGFFMAHVFAGHLTFVQNYIWLPLIFLCLHKFVDVLQLRYAILAGLALGIQILGGFPQIAFCSIIAIILYGAYHVVLRLKHGMANSISRLVCGMIVILLFGFSLASVQILPTYEFTQLSSRSGGVTFDFATIGSFDPAHFITFLMPNFFGNPANGDYWKSLEIWHFWELCAYVGIGPLLLMCFHKKESHIRHVQTFLVFLLLLSLFLSLGRYNPFSQLIYQLPGFHHFRVPASMLYLYVFSISILAGFGLTAVSQIDSCPASYKVALLVGFLCFGILLIGLLVTPAHFVRYVSYITRPSDLTPWLIPRGQDALKLSVYTGAGFFFLAVGLIYLIRRHRASHLWAIAVFLAVTMVDLFAFSHSLIKTTDLNVDQKRMQLITALNSDQEIHRIVAMSDIRAPNDGLTYRYQDIQGYDPLILKRYLSYLNRSQNTPMSFEAVNVGHVRHLGNDLIRMLNVKYAISNDIGLMQIDSPLPRAYIVHKAVVVSTDEVLDFMMSDDFSPEEIVVFEEPKQAEAFSLVLGSPPGVGGKGESNRTMPDETERCKIQAYENEQIDLTVTMNQDGYLVLSEISYPGWVAYVNGHETPLLTGNYIFRVLPVPKGNHDIVIRFEPRSFRFGIIISAVTLCCFALSLAWALVRNRLR